QMKRHQPRSKGPGFLDPKVEGVKGRKASAVFVSRVNGLVSPAQTVEIAVGDSGIRNAGCQAEAQPGFPVLRKLATCDDREDVGLVEIEGSISFALVISPSAHHEGVRDPSKELRIGIVAQEKLRAIRATDAVRLDKWPGGHVRGY